MVDKIWFVYVGDHHEGPFSVSDIGQKIGAGIVAREAYVWKEGMGDWKPMAEVSDFQSILAAPAPTFSAAGSSGTFDGTGGESNSLTSSIAPDASGPRVTLGAKKTSSTVTALPSAGMADTAPVQGGTKKKKKISVGVIVFGIFAAFLLALLQGWLDPILQNPAMKSQVSSIQIGLVNKFPALGGILPSISRPDDIDDADFEVLKEAASGPVETVGAKMAVALSKADIIAPQFFVASNLPDGTLIEIKVIGIGETLLNTTEFMATAQATIQKRLGKSEAIRAPDGKAIPRGSYQIYAYEAANQPPDIQNTVLAGLKPSATKLPASLPQGKKVVFYGTQFLGGPKDATYTQRLTAFHDTIKKKAAGELAETKQFAGTIEAQFSETIQKFATIKAIKVKAQRVKKWGEFHNSWLALHENMSKRLQGLTPDILKADYFYGILYELAQSAILSMTKLHELENSYFTAEIDPKAYDTQHADAENIAKTALETFKSKIQQAEQIPPSTSGLPRKEGLN